VHRVAVQEARDANGSTREQGGAGDRDSDSDSDSDRDSDRDSDSDRDRVGDLAMSVPVTAGTSAATEGPVVVGYDGSAGAEAALAWAAREAVLRRCELVVVHADFWDADALELPAFHDERGVEQAILEQGVDRARRLQPEIVVTGRRAVPPAPEALVHESDRAGLLVVGSSGRGPVERALVGSVSRYCVEHARCPVVVVPRPSMPAGAS
jgi:nucleotide-binding universal stress UspA family protein